MSNKVLNINCIVDHIAASIISLLEIQNTDIEKFNKKDDTQRHFLHNVFSMFQKRLRSSICIYEYMTSI